MVVYLLIQTYYREEAPLSGLRWFVTEYDNDGMNWIKNVDMVT